MMLVLAVGEIDFSKSARHRFFMNRARATSKQQHRSTSAAVARAIC
jgi:hypothetical protein